GKEFLACYLQTKAFDPRANQCQVDCAPDAIPSMVERSPVPEEIELMRYYRQSLASQRPPPFSQTRSELCLRRRRSIPQRNPPPEPENHRQPPCRPQPTVISLCVRTVVRPRGWLWKRSFATNGPRVSERAGEQALLSAVAPAMASPLAIW